LIQGALTSSSKDEFDDIKFEVGRVSREKALVHTTFDLSKKIHDLR